MGYELPIRNKKTPAAPNDQGTGLASLVNFVSLSDAFYHQDSACHGKFYAPVLADAEAIGRFGVVGQIFSEFQRIRCGGVKAHFRNDASAGLGRDLIERSHRAGAVADLHSAGCFRMRYRRSSTSWVVNRPARTSRDARRSAAWNDGLNDSMSSTVVSSSPRRAGESFQSDASATARRDSSLARSHTGSLELPIPPRKAEGFQTIRCAFSRGRKRRTIRSVTARFGCGEWNTTGSERIENFVVRRCMQLELYGRALVCQFFSVTVFAFVHEGEVFHRAGNATIAWSVETTALSAAEVRPVKEPKGSFCKAKLFHRGKCVV